MKRPCAVEDCPSPHHSHGYCSKHSQRWVLHGDPLVTLLIRDDPVRRFWSHVNKDGPVPAKRPDLGPCWVWTGCKVGGYGHVKWKGRTRKAHQVAWELERGPRPKGLEPDHRCDTPACVNVWTHIEYVTRPANQRRIVPRNAKVTHCPKGHPYDEANTCHTRNGRRVCRACKRESARHHAARLGRYRLTDATTD